MKSFISTSLFIAITASGYALDTIKVGELSDSTTWKDGGMISPTVAGVLDKTCLDGQYYSVSKDLSTVQLNTGWNNGNYNVKFIADAEAKIPTLTLLSMDDSNGVIAMRGGAGGTSAVSQNLTFENGNFNLINSTGKTYTRINLGVNNSGKASGNKAMVKTLTFAEEVNMTVATNLYFDVMHSDWSTSYSKDSHLTNIVNFNGTFLSNSDKSTYIRGVSFNSGANSNITFGRLLTENYANVTFNGNVKVQTTSITNNSSMWVQATSNVFVNKELNIITTGSNHNLSINGNITFGANASLVANGGYGTVVINDGGVLTLNSATHSFQANGCIRLNGGGKIVLNSTNAYWGNYSGNRSASLWLSSSSTPDNIKMSYLDVNVFNKLDGICFGSNSSGSYGSQMTITLGQGDGVMLELGYLSVALDTISGYLMGDSKLIFVNFRNGAVKVNDVRSSTIVDGVEYIDDLSCITAEGYENFYLEEAEGGGYWLLATQVPEPATFALVIGALAIGFTAYRKRK